MLRGAAAESTSSSHFFSLSERQHGHPTLSQSNPSWITSKVTLFQVSTVPLSVLLTRML